jgi:hypothetical protein
LKLLRIRTHNPLHWDEWYESFIRRVGFLPLARLLNRGLETHTFHLPSGEITMTLQDIAMILGLPIDGTLVCGMMSSTGWRESVGQAVGLQPPNVPGDEKDKKTTSMHSGWLTTHFNTCLEGVEDTVIQRYVWSCVSHMHNE